METRSCACGCGKPITGDRRKRYFSDACRMRVKRGGAQAQVVPLRGEVAKRGSIEEAYRSELEKLGQAESGLGRTVLALAARMDVGNETGSALSAVAKQLAATMTEVKTSAPRPASPVDQLRQKRLERMGLTSGA